jgi:hypothetical protein
MSLAPTALVPTWVNLPNRDAEWLQIAQTNPDRFVRALALHVGPHQQSADGDEFAELRGVYAALRHLAQARGPAWEGLIDAGVVDQLCESVVHARAALLFGASTNGGFSGALSQLAQGQVRRLLVTRSRYGAH